VRELTGGQTKARLQVAKQDFSVSVHLDGLKNLLVHGDLICFAGGRGLVGLLLLGEDVTFGSLETTLTVATEVFVVDCCRDLNLLDVQLGAGGNHKVLVDTTDGYAVHLVWA